MYENFITKIIILKNNQKKEEEISLNMSCQNRIEPVSISLDRAAD